MAAVNWVLRGVRDKGLLTLILTIFTLIPFQRRFHGYFDSLSRSLKLPDFSLPEFFSTKIHLYYSDVLIVAAAVALLIRFKTPLKAFFWAGPSKYLTLLFMTYLGSTALSITGDYALQYWKLCEFSIIFLFFNTLCFLRTRVDLPQLVRWVAWIVVIAAVSQCLIALCQYFFQDSLGLRYLGERNVKKFRFPSTGNPLWAFGGSSGVNAESSFVYRAAGTFDHPNIFGGFLFTGILSCCFLAIEEGRKWVKGSLVFALFLQVIVLYLTFCRSAILALVVALLAWGILQLRQIIKTQGIRSLAFKWLFILTGAILFSGLLGLILFYSQLQARGGMVNYNPVSKHSDSERIVYMKAAAEMIQEHPLLGVGYNNFQIYISRLQHQFPHYLLHSRVHSIYLLIASEGGLLSLSCFLLFLLSIGRTACRGIVALPGRFQPIVFLSSVFLGYLIIGGCDFYFLSTPQGSIPFFGIAALLYGSSLDT
jgi:hypothetical protein